MVRVNSFGTELCIRSKDSYILINLVTFQVVLLGICRAIPAITPALEAFLEVKFFFDLTGVSHRFFYVAGLWAIQANVD